MRKVKETTSDELKEGIVALAEDIIDMGDDIQAIDDNVDICRNCIMKLTDCIWDTNDAMELLTEVVKSHEKEIKKLWCWTYALVIVVTALVAWFIYLCFMA